MYRILTYRAAAVARRFQSKSCLRRGESHTAVGPAAAVSNSVERDFLQHALDYRPGQLVHGYRVTQVTPVQELGLAAVMLEHEKTGAGHLHVARDDANNVFGVSFRTTPRDSTGVPHILEHTALCGSQRFPVRDPFFKMLNRSLSTFMNAFTASDWTMYPFSTQNKKDFRNLMSVYLDAAFFPLLRESDFCQEGWRLEHEDPKDKSSPIIFKGIVFNEMKGHFSTPHSVFNEAMQNHLLPDHTYAVVSGGDPLVIPDLTWEALKEFHATHYHPSNSRFFTYGDQPLEDHLAYIDEYVLSKFGKIAVDTAVPKQNRWQEPLRKTIACRYNDMAAQKDKQTTVAVCFLLEDVCDTYESFLLKIVSDLLVDGENAPFYKTLRECNIGSNYSPTLGYEGSTRDSWFAVGLEGIAAGDVDTVVPLIDETIDEVIKTGFEKDRIAALLHKIELGLKHQTTSFGLNLAMAAVTPWNHGGNPVSGFCINDLVRRFQQHMQDDPHVLQGLVKKYMKDSRHRLTLIMHPDESYEQKLAARESEKLAGLVSQLDTSQKELIYARGLELMEEQMASQDPGCLPTLLVSDVAEKLKLTQLSFERIGGVKTQLCCEPTNEICYFNAVSSVNDLPADLLPYVPLFCSVVTKMGAGDMNFKQLSQAMDMCSGGLTVSPHVTAHHSDLNAYESGIVFSSFCLEKNVESMFALWSDIVTRLDVSDHNRLTTLVQMEAADLAASLAQSGHAYAMRHSAANLSAAAKLSESLSGISQVRFMKEVAAKSDASEITAKLKSLARWLLRKNSLRCALNVEGKARDRATSALHSLLAGLPGDASSVPGKCNKELSRTPSEMTFFKLGFNVNYIGASVPAVAYTHPDFGGLTVLARLLTNKYLHREIREKGGAYGGGATTASSGALSFYSYRDPNCSKTLDVFRSAAAWIHSGNFEQRDVDEAILGAFQKIDKPLAPGDKGMSQFLYGISDDLKQAHRESVRSTNVHTIRSITERYLKDGSCHGITVLGPDAASVGTEASSWKVVVD